MVDGVTHGKDTLPTDLPVSIIPSTKPYATSSEANM